MPAPAPRPESRKARWSYLITVSPNPHEEVVWLYVSVNEVLVVDILNPSNHLSRQNLTVFDYPFSISAQRGGVTINSNKALLKNVRAPT